MAAEKRPTADQPLRRDATVGDGKFGDKLAWLASRIISSIPHPNRDPGGFAGSQNTEFLAVWLHKSTNVASLQQMAAHRQSVAQVWPRLAGDYCVEFYVLTPNPEGFVLRWTVKRARLHIAELIHRIRIDSAHGYSCAPDRPLQICQLEPRILMSASPVAIVADVPAPEMSSDAAPSDGDVPVGQAVPTQAVDSAGSTTESQAADPTAQTVELVLVDTSADNYQQLVDDIVNNADESRGFELFLFDSSRDGIEQITELLSDYSDVDALHIVSHGSEGNVQLGNSTLNMNHLAAYAEQLQSWADSFNADTDILIYGCDLAGSESGQELVESLSVLTGADVAASEDLTGHASLGGDWDLEFHVGLLNTDIAFSESLISSWRAVLDGTTVTQTADVVNAGDLSSIAALNADDGGDGISLREAIIAANADAAADTITLSAGIYQLSITGAELNDGSVGDLDIINPLTITGADAATTIIDGQDLDRVFEIFDVVTIENVTIEDGNVAGGDGGGIRVDATGDLTLQQSYVQLNTTDRGAGIFNAGLLQLTDVEVIDNIAAGGTAAGGGLYNASSATVDQSLFYNNQATDGAGIYADAAAIDLTLTNVTISTNVATNQGGGLYANNVTVDITNSTIVYNDAQGGPQPPGDGIFVSGGGGDANLKNTILDNPLGDNASKKLTSLGGNIDSGSAALKTPLLSDQENTDARLGPLQNNGGFSRTYALHPLSLAINSGESAGAPLVDQRGFARPVGVGFDSGAFEFEYNVLIVTTTADSGVGSLRNAVTLA